LHGVFQGVRDCTAKPCKQGFTVESNKRGAIWCHLNQLIKLEFFGAHGVAIDCVMCANLFEDVELVDERIAYFKAAKECADGVHDVFQ
jgi:hypothetical protein